MGGGATVSSITVTPTTASIPVTGTQQFVATAKYSDATTAVVTKTAIWTSGNAGATVGLHTGLATGVTANGTPVIITATLGTHSATAALTVTPATLVSIAVTPLTASISAGNTQQFVATGTFSDGSHSVVTTTASWTSATLGVATIGLHTGLATGVAAGTTNITAALSGVTSSPVAVLTVTAAAASLVCTGGAACVPLGLADNFVILGQSTITGTGNSITGNIGLSPLAGSFITVPCADMLTGKVYDVDGAYTGGAGCSMPGPGANKTTVDTAVANMVTAYNDAAGRVSPAPTTELGTGNISGMTLTPGIYKWSTGLLIYAGSPSGDATGVTLDCAGGTGGGSTAVFIFQIATPQTLALGQVATPASINLTGGCLPSNIFWQVGGNVDIFAGSVFNGNILTATQVAMRAGAVLHGRALAQTAVTLISNTVGP
jgi:hypothetical protein